jgi:hypothetical protein
VGGAFDGTGKPYGGGSYRSIIILGLVVGFIIVAILISPVWLPFFGIELPASN